MIIVGCDFHPSWQQIAVFDTETGESSERKLVNGDGEAEHFYRQLPVGSLVGMEAWVTVSGSSIACSRWDTKCGSGTRPRSAPATCANNDHPFHIHPRS